MSQTMPAAFEKVSTYPLSPLMEKPLVPLPPSSHDIPGAIPGSFGEPFDMVFPRIPEALVDTLRFWAPVFISAIAFVLAFVFTIELLRPQNLYYLQDTVGLIHPTTRTSILFPAPQTTGPYSQLDLTMMWNIQHSALDELHEARKAAWYFASQSTSLQENLSDMRSELSRWGFDHDGVVDGLAKVSASLGSGRVALVEIVAEMDMMIERCVFVRSKIIDGVSKIIG